MSRRKKSSPSALEDGAVCRMEIGCTGRGTHKRIKLAGADVVGEIPLSEIVPLKGSPETFAEDGHFVEIEFAPEMHFAWTPEETSFPHFTFPFACGFCDRNLPLRQDNLYRKLRALKAAGIYFLDLSSLDAIRS